MVDLTADDFRHYPEREGPSGDGPRPSARDFWLFFVGVPLGCALWATAVGVGPARVLGFPYGMLYVGIQMLAAFCGNGLTALLAARVLGRFRPPLWGVLLAGYALGWLPLYVFYLNHFAWFSGLFPQIVQAGLRPATGWTSAYLFHAARYSLPFVPMWIAAVYGYRFLTGVTFFGQPQVRHPTSSRPKGDAAGGTGVVPAPRPSVDIMLPPGNPKETTPPFLAASRLPPGDVALAIKAEEHYIRIWSRSGNDMIRYRFSDAVRELADRNGGQVHRSWWINWDAVSDCRHRGRSLELILDNGLEVPVSLAYKTDAQRRLGSRRGD